MMANESRNWHIRQMVLSDAARVVEMATALSAHEGQGPPPFEVSDVERYGFGESKRFDGFIAERDGQAIGYALFHDSYNVGLGAPGLHMIDLFVEPEARRSGIARAIMATLAHEAEARGGSWVTWQSVVSNEDAISFYEAIGGRRFRAADFELGERPFRDLLVKP